MTVYERDDRIGGLLMYGIPNMKLEKRFIERKIEIMKEEGVEFVTGTDVGKDVKAAKILKEYDRVILACGAKNPRDIKAAGKRCGRHLFCGRFSYLYDKEPVKFGFERPEIYLSKREKCHHYRWW